MCVCACVCVIDGIICLVVCLFLFVVPCLHSAAWLPRLERLALLRGLDRFEKNTLLLLAGSMVSVTLETLVCMFVVCVCVVVCVCCCFCACCRVSRVTLIIIIS